MEGSVKSTQNSWFMGDLNLGVMIMTNPVFQPKGWVFRRIEWAGLFAEHTEHPLPIRGVESHAHVRHGNMQGSYPAR